MTTNGNAPSVNELKDLMRKSVNKNYAEGVIVAQVQDSSDLPLNFLRVYRTDTRQQVVIASQRYAKDVWLNLRYDASGALYVDSVNVDRTSEYYADASTALQTYADGAQTTTVWGANNLKMGLVIPSGTSPGTLKLWVLPLWWNGDYTLEPLEYDPAALLPGSAYQFRWLKVGISTLTGAIVTGTSTSAEYATVNVLAADLDALRDIDLGAGVIPLAGVTLAYGQTDIALSRFVPIMPFGNTTPGYNDVHPRWQMPAATEVTIASGVIEITQNIHSVDTEGDIASDDLDTITAPTLTTMLYLFPANGARTVVVKHATGNIRTWDGSDITLDEQYKCVRFLYIPLLSYWVAEAVGGGSGGANTALSNLASVAINTSLVSDTDNTDNLGSTTIKWANVFTNALVLEERTAPGTPTSGDVIIYAKSDGNVYAKDDTGTERNLSAGGVSSVVAGTNISVDNTDPANPIVSATSSPGGGASPATFEARLTLTSGTPVTTTDVTGAGTIYLTPFRGNYIGLYNGSAWELLALSEISLSLSGLNPWSIHDVFVYNNAGTPTLELTAWTAGASGSITGATNATPIVITSNSHGLSTDDIVTISGVGGNTAANGTFRITVTGATTYTLQTLAGANVAGSGAYTSGGTWYLGNYVGSRATALTTQNGVYVKTGATTRRYVGTIAIGSTAGQVDDAENRRHLWNYYHRQQRPFKRDETTSSWGVTNSPGTWRVIRGDFANRIDMVVGVSEDPLDLFASLTQTGLMIGLGIDSRTANGAQTGYNSASISEATTRYTSIVSAGMHKIHALENRSTSSTCTGYGGDVTYGTYTRLQGFVMG